MGERVSSAIIGNFGGSLDNISFEVKFVNAGTGSEVWDDPNATGSWNHVIERVMPRDRHHGPMIGILDLAKLRPTPVVLRDVIVAIGEDVRAGRYGNFTFVVSSEDAATRSIVSDIASAKDVAIFISSSPTHLDQAHPAGDLTVKDRETLGLVLQAGGTVTAAELAEQLGIENTTAGNRLIALNKKGYLQRLERPHPGGDQFLDARSVRLSRP
jgi:predicted DNA binding protein